MPVRVALLALLALPAVASAESPVYVWANQPSSVQYIPSRGYTSNAAGAVTIRRNEPGVYDVQLAGLGHAARGGNVQVTAYGSGPGHCNVERWVPSGPGLSVRVRCYKGTIPTDRMFSLLFTPPVAAEPAESEAVVRFAWAGQAGRPAYQAAAPYVANGGQPVNVKRTGPGRYAVSFTGVGAAEARGGNVQVTPYGTGPHTCNVINWTAAESSLQVQVACFQGNAPADSAFSVLFTPAR